MVRGLDYYNGTCFEIKIVENDEVFGESSQNTILAGGRYDNLATQFGYSKPLPSVGWAAGINRLVLIIEHL